MHQPIPLHEANANTSTLDGTLVAMPTLASWMNGRRSVLISLRLRRLQSLRNAVLAWNEIHSQCCTNRQYSLLHHWHTVDLVDHHCDHGHALPRVFR
jgi:hypothetical protein